VTSGMPAQLPTGVLELLDGSGLPAKVGTTVLLATADDDGWPHLAMLSPGEVLATDDGTIRLALYASSGTSRALRQRGRALLSVVAEGAAYRIRVRARHVPEPPVPGADELFVAAIEGIEEDRVSYARISHGITYELFDAESTVERWTAKLNRLRTIG
jgi:hypothetical protein